MCGCLADGVFNTESAYGTRKSFGLLSEIQATAVEEPRALPEMVAPSVHEKLRRRRWWCGQLDFRLDVGGASSFLRPATIEGAVEDALLPDEGYCACRRTRGQYKTVNDWRLQ
jgi:hypothetical protein